MNHDISINEKKVLPDLGYYAVHSNLLESFYSMYMAQMVSDMLMDIFDTTSFAYFHV